MAGIRIKVDDYKDLQKQMKGVDKAARLALRKRIREAGKPLAAQITEGGGSEMPQTGGAQESYLGAKATLSQTMSSLRILYNKKGPQVRIPNRAGFIRHPVFGNREIWRNTKVPAGAWDRAFDEHKDETLAIVSKVLDDVAREIM